MCKISATGIEMAHSAKPCACCGGVVVIDSHDATVLYSWDHVEHEDCYFDNHPHNLTCLVCGIQSKILEFKQVGNTAYLSSSSLLILFFYCNR